MLAVSVALIFPVAFLLAAGTIFSMLSSHGQRMIDALLLRDSSTMAAAPMPPRPALIPIESRATSARRRHPGMNGTWEATFAPTLKAA